MFFLSRRMTPAVGRQHDESGEFYEPGSSTYWQSAKSGKWTAGRERMRNQPGEDIDDKSQQPIAMYTKLGAQYDTLPLTCRVFFLKSRISLYYDIILQWTIFANFVSIYNTQLSFVVKFLFFSLIYRSCLFLLPVRWMKTPYKWRRSSGQLLTTLAMVDVLPCL